MPPRRVRRRDRTSGRSAPPRPAAAPAPGRRRTRPPRPAGPSAPTSIGVPAGVCLAAFSSRLTNTCSSRISSIGTSGRSAGKRRRDRVAAQLLLGAEQRHADHVGQQLPLLLHLQRAGLDPDHVEQVGHEPAHAVRLLDDRARELAPRGGVGLRVLQQRARRALDRGERRAHVVRERAQERGPEPLRLDLDLGLAGSARPAPAARARRAVWPASVSSRRRRAGSRKSAGSASGSPRTPTVRPDDASGR